MTRGQLKTILLSNLNDVGVTFDDVSLNASIQMAYNEVVIRSKCIIKSASVLQVANSPYYDFVALGMTDYLGLIGIFNVATQFWLRDDISLRDFDRLRRNWELWTGAPQFWAPHSLQYTAIAPNEAMVVDQHFTIWYWAIAPTLTSDSDSFLIATDKQNLLENYGTADLLEDAKEWVKATDYMLTYEEDLEEYRQRCVKLAKADLLQRV